jgi:uncharacterized protein YbaR (Trm112 family)
MGKLLILGGVGRVHSDAFSGDRMPIPHDLLQILVCPVCKAALTLVNADTGLRCGTCRRVYPIRDDIPVMLVDEARIED